MKKWLFQFETVAVAVIGIFSAVFLVQTYDYGRRAGLFPRLISWTVLVLILIFVVSRVRRAWGRSKEAAPAKPVGALDKAGRPAGVKWTLSFGLALAYCLLVYLIGFGPATFGYLLAHIQLAGNRRRAIAAVYALVVAAIMVLMGTFFKIPLPQGILVEPWIGSL